MSENYDGPAMADGVGKARDKIKRLERVVGRYRKALSDIYDMASWHTDDEADPGDESPDDMTAHTNGLIRLRIRKALENTDE
jgi:hypothetical protein